MSASVHCPTRAVLAALSSESRNPESRLRTLPTLGPLQLVTAFVRHASFGAGVVSDEPGRLLASVGHYGDAPGEFLWPCDVARLSAQELAVVDGAGCRVQILSSTDLSPLRQFGCEGNGDGEFEQATCVTVDADGRVLVGDDGLERIQCFDADGAFLYRLRDNVRPCDSIAADSQSQCFCWSSVRRAIVVFAPDGSESTPVTEMLSGASVCCVRVNADDDLLALDSNSLEVRQWRADGTFMRRFGSRAPGFQWCHGIAVDTAGNVLVSNAVQRVVRLYRADGMFVRNVTSYSPDCQPCGVCVTAHGHVVVTDVDTYSVQLWS